MYDAPDIPDDRPRARFTLRELLVVVFVLGCLMALLLPSTRHAGEAARRVKCANNLKQYGLAIHNYHDVYNSLPPGGLWNVSSTDWNIPVPSWQLRIMPFMESQRVYDRVDWDLLNPGKVDIGTESVVTGTAGRANRMREVIMNYQKCPSDEGEELINGFAQTSYSGSLGSQRTPSANANCNQFLQVAGFHYENLSWNADHGNSWRKQDVSGLFGRMGFDEKFPITDIKDGTSNVIMVGEILINCHDHAIYGTGPWHYNGAGTAHASTSVPVNSFTTCANSERDALRRGYPFPRCWAKSNWNHSWGFRSRHKGGAQMVFADGSVQFIPNDISYLVYQYLGGREDNRGPIEF